MKMNHAGELVFGYDHEANLGLDVFRTHSILEKIPETESSISAKLSGFETGYLRKIIQSDEIVITPAEVDTILDLIENLPQESREFDDPARIARNIRSLQDSVEELSGPSAKISV